MDAGAHATRSPERENVAVKRILLTFGGKAYDDQVARTWKGSKAASQVHLGYDEVRVFDDAWLMTTPFYSLNRWIFERQPQHGFGFCSWKPYIILAAMRNYCETGDVVMYLDGDTFPIADIGCLFDTAAREGVMLFEEQGCINREWTKGDCFAAMGCAGDAGNSNITEAQTEETLMRFRKAPQACGRFSLWRAGDYRNIQLLMEWQAYALNPMTTFHEKSFFLPQFDSSTLFRNSCEQSVLGNLAVKYGIPTHRTPDQNGWPQARVGKAPVTVETQFSRPGGTEWHKPDCDCGKCEPYKPEDSYPQLFLQQWRSGNILDRTGSRFRNV